MNMDDEIFNDYKINKDIALPLNDNNQVIESRNPAKPFNNSLIIDLGNYIRNVRI